MSRHREPGRVVRIPLGDGFVGWGRQLRSVRVEFYDRFDAEADAGQIDPQEVVGGEVAFTVAVMDRAFRRNSGWQLLDVVPLSQQEQAEVYVVQAGSSGRAQRLLGEARWLVG